MSAPEKVVPNQTASERFVEALALVPELSLVEDTIRSSFASDVAPMREIPEYLLSLGGKRIRPVLTLLCAKALGANAVSEDLITVASGIELIHMATLMHDDIIDQSPVRRHKESPYAKFGTNLTLLSGDFLLTRAFGLCAKLDDEIVVATEKACIELVEGEALETPLHFDKHSRETSITIATRKTASLFRLAAFCSGHLSGAKKETILALCEFGEALGIAFQMIDDILDVLATEETLGKRPGLDIAERKPSIVNVLWLESGDQRAERLLEPPSLKDETAYVQDALQFLSTSEVIEEAKSLARQYGERASQALKMALKINGPHNTAGDALFDVIEFALSRLR
jgi:octaprenyl-diphosphate synthase